ncbi:MAG: hypothetical protein WDO70_09680 [Alphaproteobacteria bacterium]
MTSAKNVLVAFGAAATLLLASGAAWAEKKATAPSIVRQEKNIKIVHSVALPPASTGNIIAALLPALVAVGIGVKTLRLKKAKKPDSSKGKNACVSDNSIYSDPIPPLNAGWDHVFRDAIVTHACDPLTNMGLKLPKSNKGFFRECTPKERLINQKDATPASSVISEHDKHRERFDDAATHAAIRRAVIEESPDRLVLRDPRTNEALITLVPDTGPMLPGQKPLPLFAPPPSQPFSAPKQPQKPVRHLRVISSQKPTKG